MFPKEKETQPKTCKNNWYKWEGKGKS